MFSENYSRVCSLYWYMETDSIDTLHQVHTVRTLEESKYWYAVRTLEVSKYRYAGINRYSTWYRYIL